MRQNKARMIMRDGKKHKKYEEKHINTAGTTCFGALVRR